MLAGLLVVILSAAPDDKKVTFADQVSAIFQQRCNSCHNSDKQKGGAFARLLRQRDEGWRIGQVVEAGDPEGSRLYRAHHAQ